MKNYETKKVIEDFRKVLKNLDEKIDKIQANGKKKISWKERISFTTIGVGLIGSGWSYAISQAVEIAAKYGLMSSASFLHSVFGISIGFVGYMMAHKGLEGTWL